MFDPCTAHQTSQALTPPIGGVLLSGTAKVPEIPLLSLCAGNRSVRSHLTCQFTHAINSPAQGFGIAVDT